MATLLDAERSKRIVALALAPAMWVLAVDSWVSHYAAKSEAHYSQFIPVVFGGVAGVALILAALPSAPRLLNLTFIASGVLSALIGLAGTYYHMESLFKTMGDEAFTWEALNEALSVAPPTFAPAAFIGVGGILVLLGMGVVVLQLRLGLRGEAVPAMAAQGDNLRHFEQPRKSAAR